MDFLYYIKIGDVRYGVTSEDEDFVEYMDLKKKGKRFVTPKSNLQRRVEKGEVELTKEE